MKMVFKPTLFICLLLLFSTCKKDPLPEDSKRYRKSWQERLEGKWSMFKIEADGKDSSLYLEIDSIPFYCDWMFKRRTNDTRDIDDDDTYVWVKTKKETFFHSLSYKIKVTAKLDSTNNSISRDGYYYGEIIYYTVRYRDIDPNDNFRFYTDIASNYTADSNAIEIKSFGPVNCFSQKYILPKNNVNLTGHELDQQTCIYVEKFTILSIENNILKIKQDHSKASNCGLNESKEYIYYLMKIE